MDHRGGNELQGMHAEGKRVAILDGELFGFCREFHELREHGESLCTRDDCHFGVQFHKARDSAGVIRFQMVNDQVVGLAASKSLFKVSFPVSDLAKIYRIGDRDLFVLDQKRVVCHACRHDVLAFEQVDVGIVNANVLDVLTQILHNITS